MTTLVPKFDLGATIAGTANRPFNEKLAEIYSVKDFGAVGDGLTDDSTAINNCILAANNANPVGSSSGSTGTARVTVYFPGGVYLCKSTLIFYPFINYIGVRSTTYNNTVPGNDNDMHGSMIQADVSIYTNNTATQGVLVYVYTGDITIENLGFVGTAGLTSNPSIGIQWGSSGGGRPFEAPGGTNTSGVLMIGSRVLGFTQGFQACTLNDAKFFNIGIENCTVGIEWSQNNAVNGSQQAEFHGCEFFACSTGWSIGQSTGYNLKVFGGNFTNNGANQNGVVYTATASLPSIQMTFVGVDFVSNVTYASTTHHVLINGNYDSQFLMFNFVGCNFSGSQVIFERNTGSTDFKNWVFNGCNFIQANIYLSNCSQGQILGGNFYTNSYVTLANSTNITIKNANFSGYTAGPAIDVGTANCGSSYFGYNTFTGVTTPITIYNSATNATILMENNLGVTSSPVMGKIIDYRNNITFANIGTPSNGSIIYVSDGTIANPVAAAGTGCIAKRLNGVWIGN
jgi:hypothetical protein